MNIAAGRLTNTEVEANAKESALSERATETNLLVEEIN